MSRLDELGSIVGSFLHPNRAADLMAAVGGDAALAKKFEDALTIADDVERMRAVRRLAADHQWSRGPARPAPAPPSEAPPMTFEDRVRRDPEIRATLMEINPEMAGNMGTASLEDIFAALRSPAQVRRGRPRKAPLAGKVAPKVEDEIRALIPLGRPGPGVPVGGPSGPGVLVSRPGGMIPAPLRGLPPGRPSGMIPAGPRAMIPADQAAAEGIASQFDEMLGLPAPPRQPRIEYKGPIGPGTVVDEIPTGRPRGGAAAVADDMSYRPDTPRTPEPPKRRLPKGTKRAAAAVAAGAAGLSMLPDDVEAPAVTSGGEADLAAESRPAPMVEATPDVPEPTVAQAPQDYSLQARALINRLNDMRRAAGGEVPEAPAMMAEINRLIEMGNEQRRNPSYSYPQQDPARDPYQQARDLIAQVNQMYRQGMTPNSPEVRQIMAEVRRLQAEGDAIRNRRAG